MNLSGEVRKTEKKLKAEEEREEWCCEGEKRAMRDGGWEARYR